MAARTQVAPKAGVTRQVTAMHSRPTQPRSVGMRQYRAARQYNGTGYYRGSRYAGTRYYGNSGYTGTRYYGNSGYYTGPNYYYGGTGWGYPYVGTSGWPFGYSYNPYSYYGGYPYSYSYSGGYPYNYSYYGSGYGYGGSTVAAVQQRLGEMGYYQGAVDGVMGPQTRAAIAAYESRHGLSVDGRITGSLLNRLGLG
jgi:Putative peptidoglycan binding domain